MANKVKTNERILAHDFKTGFIDQWEYNELYNSYLEYIHNGCSEEEADDILGKEMRIFYDLRADRKKKERELEKARAIDKIQVETGSTYDEAVEVYEANRRAEQQDKQMNAERRAKFNDFGDVAYEATMERRISVI